MKRKGARLGQHFLTGTWAANKLVTSAGVGAKDTALEIGPGTGALTRQLLATGARVIAIEKDGVLVARLKETFAAELTNERLTLIEGDVRDLDLKKTKIGPYILAANIPYYITGEIIRQFLSSDVQPTTMALLVQKEVARRIVARDKKESILSISVKVYGTPEIAAVVSRGNFVPPPSVDSAILVVKDISKKFFVSFDEDLFFKIVRTGFSSKRKLLAGNLGKIFGRERVARALVAANIPEKARAEDVALDQWRSVTEAIANFPSS
jgi:16S rRNA (adenine1518-N6/adenine1519-N6)-dimethyltransferase